MGLRTAVYVNEEIKSMKDFITEEKERSSRTYVGVRGAPHQLSLVGPPTRIATWYLQFILLKYIFRRI